MAFTSAVIRSSYVKTLSASLASRIRSRRFAASTAASDPSQVVCVGSSPIDATISTASATNGDKLSNPSIVSDARIDEHTHSTSRDKTHVPSDVRSAFDWSWSKRPDLIFFKTVAAARSAENPGTRGTDPRMIIGTGMEFSLRLRRVRLPQRFRSTGETDDCWVCVIDVRPDHGPRLTRDDLEVQRGRVRTVFDRLGLAVPGDSNPDPRSPDQDRHVFDRFRFDVVDPRPDFTRDFLDLEEESSFGRSDGGSLIGGHL